MVQVEDVLDLLQILVLHASSRCALLTWVRWVRNAYLIYHDVAQVNVLSGQCLHQSRSFVNTQLLRNANCNESGVVVILKLSVDLLDSLLQRVQRLEQLVFNIASHRLTLRRCHHRLGLFQDASKLLFKFNKFL